MLTSVFQASIIVLRAAPIGTDLALGLLYTLELISTQNDDRDSKREISL